MPSTEKRKRHRGAACVHCRQMKMRCDASNMFPSACSRCAKVGRSCTIDPDFQRTGVRDRLHTLEQEVQTIRNAQVFGPSPVSKATPSGASSENPGLQRGVPDVLLSKTLPSKDVLRLMLLSTEFFTTTVVLDSTTIDIEDACDIIVEYYDRYHPLFPLLQDLETVVQDFQSCSLLLWAIVAITRRDLAVELSNSIRKLAGREILETKTPSMPLIHALLILSWWPLPYGAQSEDPSWLYCGTAVHKALALGLHRPAFLADFVNWTLPTETTILTRQKTWIACFIANQSISSMLGIPATVGVDHSINKALKDWPEQVPTILRSLLHVAVISSSFNNTLGHYNGTPDGLFPDADHVMHIFEADLDGLDSSCWDEWNPTVRVFALWTKLRLYSFDAAADEAHGDIHPSAQRNIKAVGRVSKGFSAATRLIDVACAIAGGPDQSPQSTAAPSGSSPAQPTPPRAWTGFERAAVTYAIMYLLKVAIFSDFSTRSREDAHNTIRKGLVALKRNRTSLKHDATSRICDIIEFVSRLPGRDSTSRASQLPEPGQRVRSRMSQNLVYDIVRSALVRFDGEEGRKRYPYSSKGKTSASVNADTPFSRMPESSIANRAPDAGPEQETHTQYAYNAHTAGSVSSAQSGQDPSLSEAHTFDLDMFNDYPSTLPPSDMFWSDWDLAFSEFYSR